MIQELWRWDRQDASCPWLLGQFVPLPQHQDRNRLPAV